MVRTKNYIFLETLKHNKNAEHSVQFFGTFCKFSGTKYNDVTPYVQSNINFLKMWYILYIIRKIIQNWSILLKGLGVYVSSFQVWNKNYDLIIYGPLNMKIVNFKISVVNFVFWILFWWYTTLKSLETENSLRSVKFSISLIEIGFNKISQCIHPYGFNIFNK